MASLSPRTRPALLCGIFTLLFLEIRSEIVGRNLTPAVQSPTKESPTPHDITRPTVAAVNKKNVSTATFPLSSTEKTRSENVMGSENLTKSAGEAKTTVANAVKTITAPALKSDQQQNQSAKATTALPKTDLRTPNFTTVTQKTTISTLAAPVPTGVSKKTNFSATNTQSQVTTEPPALNANTTENAKNLSTTTKTAFFSTSSSTVELNLTSITKLVPTNGTPGSIIPKISHTTPNPINLTESTPKMEPKTTFSNVSTTTAELLVTNVTNGGLTNATKGGIFPKISNLTTPNPINLTETTPKPETKTTFSNISATTAEHLVTNVTNLVSTNATKGGIVPKISYSTTPNPINLTEITPKLEPKTKIFNVSTTTAEHLVTNVTKLASTNATKGGIVPKLSSPTTPNPTTLPETTANNGAERCSSIGVVKKCLIVIASLAVVSIIFIISTIVLCTKLSSRRYKLKRQQRGTEMMCISSLLPERSNHRPVRYTRQRSPVPNGVLVIHNGDDSDDDTGDNLTLTSFI